MQKKNMVLLLNLKISWIRTKDLKPINYKDKNIFSKINLFKGKNINGEEKILMGWIALL